MKISGLQVDPEMLKRVEKLRSTPKFYELSRDNSGTINTEDGDTFEKSAVDDDLQLLENNYNGYLIDRNNYKSRWTPEEWDQFYQDHFESFRYIGIDGTVSIIKAPENNADIQVDAHGYPITRLQKLFEGHDAVTQFTNDHYSKYITLPNIAKDEDFIRKLESVITDEDYAGMSDADKYKIINDKYARAFGDDFLLAETVDYAAPYVPYRYHMMLDQYHNDLNAAIGSNDNITQAARTVLYGDMNDSDIRADIAAKYPPGDQMTLRELYQMTWEMDRIGVGEGMRDVLTNATDFFQHIDRPGGLYITTVDDENRFRESMLDKKLDIGFLGNVYNKMVNAGTVTGKTGQIMQEQLGMSLDSNGKATSKESGTSKWFQSIADWLSSDDIVRAQ